MRPPWLPPPDRTRPILDLALPIIGGMTSQNLLNLADTWMVGALGPAALAGVGLSSFLNFMAVAAIMGLASAVQATAARRYGEGKHGETAAPLNGGLLLSATLGVPLALLLIALAPAIVRLLNDDPEVVRQGTVYLQWRLVAVPLVGMNFSFRGYWSAVNLSRLYMKTLVTMHVANVVISYSLIFGVLGLPALGVAGAGIGTTVSVCLGTATYFRLASRHARPAGFLESWPSREQLLRLLKLGLPSSAQQLLFAAGFTALFWIVGRVGTAELAVANVLVNVTLLSVLPSIGFGLAAATLSAQALGRGDAGDARRWAWEVYRVAACVLAALALGLLLWPSAILQIFLRDPALVALGRLPLRLVAAGILLDGLGMVMMQALLGAGAARLVMTVAVALQWGLFLPLAYLLGPVLGFGLAAIWLAMILYRALQTAIFVAAWQDGRWAAIRV